MFEFLKTHVEILFNKETRTSHILVLNIKQKH